MLCAQNPNLATLDVHDVMHDGGMANGSDVDGSAFPWKDHNRIVAAVHCK